jgi:ectoine hydroxylase-related dioxygenase (phytanoyl-CoA dioxygenase family)
MAQADADRRSSETEASSAACLAALETDGFVVLPGAITPSFARAVAGELEPHFQSTPHCEGDFYGWKTTRVGGLLAKAPLVQKLVTHRQILTLAERLLGPSCDQIQLNLTQAIRVHPGERAQAPHRDEEMWPLAAKQGHWLVNVMWPMTSFSNANGATRIWPGSHHQALDRSLEAASSVAVEMEPGAALVFLGSVTHGAGANTTEAARSGIIVSYCLGWLRQYENQFLAYPRELARWFPEEIQRLIGYRMHRPNLGGWEGQDPIEYLRGADGPRPHIDALTPEIAQQLKDHYGG